MAQLSSLRLFVIFGLTVVEGLAFNLTGILQMYFSACGTQSCDRKKFQGQVNTDFTLKYGNVCPSCSCTSRCVSIGNCCPDLFLTLQPSCTRTEFLSYNKNIIADVSYLMIDRCPEGTYNNNTVIRCESEYKIEEQFTNIPVTSLETGLTYRNVHCSKCHSESLEHIISWRLQTNCEHFTDLNFASNYNEIIELAKKRHCSFSYILEHPKVLLRKCNISSTASDKINTCNVSGTWTKYDKDIEFACQTYDNPYHFFKNVFCYMCNPPNQVTSSIISQCNVTGFWETYDEKLDLACNESIQNSMTVLFKNVFCYYCNRNNTNARTGLKFIDVGVSMEESSFGPRNFTLTFKVNTFNFDIIQSEMEKKLSQRSQIRKEKNIKCDLLASGKKDINMTNIYLQFYAHEGNIGLCKNQTPFRSREDCNCDEHCYFGHKTSNKCCTDKLFSASTTCTNKDLSLHGERFLVYNSCKVRSDMELCILCSNSHDNDLFSIWPVERKIYSNTIHFKNIFCAICNENEDKVLRINDTGFNFWRVHLYCDVYMSPVYQVSFERYIDFSITQGCNYRFEKYSQVTICSDVNFEKCNMTGNWLVHDSDINYACEHLNIPVDWFDTGNPFCNICNPPKQDKVLYSSCNITGQLKVNDEIVEDDCYKMPEIQTLLPYKNIFCKKCNEEADSNRSAPVILTSYSETFVIKMPTSFRAIFSLDIYDNDQTKEEQGNGCNTTQIFDHVKDKCRELHCYPGRILLKGRCVPLLPITRYLGYILALGFSGQFHSTIDNTVQFISATKEAFRLFLMSYLELTTLEYESSYFYISSGCEEDLGRQASAIVHISVFEKIFVRDYVNRTIIETKLIGLSGKTFNVSYMDSQYEFSIHEDDKSFHLPVYINKIGLLNHCFIKESNHVTIAEKIVHSHVNKLLNCTQIELSSDEVTFSRYSILLNGVQFGHDEYLLLPFNRTRVCLELFQSVLLAKKPLDKEQYVFRIIILILTIVSLICLFLTFVTYSLFRNLRTIPGKNNMCLVFSMFFAQLFFVFGLYAYDSFEGCIIIGIMIHFFWLSTFGCLSICSFHMFRVFRSKTFLNFSEKSQRTRVFRRYILFSFGFPFLLVSVNATVNFLTFGSLGYGGSVCFLNSIMSRLITFIVPITLVCLTNIFFFVVASVKIASTPKVETDEQNQANRVHFTVYMKIFSLTGITWIFQVIDSFLPMSIFSFIVSIMNTLQGVFIFISYICNKKVLYLYKKLRSQSQHFSALRRQKGKSNTMTTSLSNT